MRGHRLRTVSYIPQGAMNSLNPVLSIGRQMRNVLVDHDERPPGGDYDAAIAAALAGVDLEARVAGLYPHELSGGMKQRVCIAMSLMLRPKLIIADEPTSALDVVTQRQVMETLGRQQQEAGIRAHPDRPRHGPDGAVRRHARGDVRRASWSRSAPSATC